VLIDVSQLAPVPDDPVQEAADDIEASPSAMWSKPLFDQTYRVALDMLSVKPTLETSEQLASAQVISCFHLPVLRY
jgi:hypothetical protein